MIYKIVIDVLLLLSNLKEELDKIKTQETGRNYDELYPLSSKGNRSIRIREKQVFVGDVALARAEAITFCNRNQANLYSVEQDDDLEEIFKMFDVQEIWMPTKVSKTLGILIDDNTGFPPLVSASGKSIGQPNPTELVDATHHLVLEKTEVKGEIGFRYKILSDTEQRKFLCTNNLSFPFTKNAIQELEDNKEIIRQNFVNFMSKIEKSKEMYSSANKFIPEYPTDSYTAKETIESQRTIQTKIGLTTSHMKDAYEKLGNIKNRGDYENVLRQVDVYWFEIGELIEAIKQPFQFPSSIIPTSKLNFDTDQVKQTIKELKLSKITEGFLIELVEVGNMEDQWKEWLHKFTLYDISLYDVGLTIISLFTFVVIVADLSFKFYEKIMSWKNGKKRLGERAGSGRNRARVDPKQIPSGSSYPMIQKLTYSSPAPSTSKVNEPMERPIIVETRLDKCQECSERTQQILPTTLYLHEKKSSGRKGKRQAKIPLHKIPSELSLFDY